MHFVITGLTAYKQYRPFLRPFDVHSTSIDPFELGDVCAIYDVEVSILVLPSINHPALAQAESESAPESDDTTEFCPTAIGKDEEVKALAAKFREVSNFVCPGVGFLFLLL